MLTNKWRVDGSGVKSQCGVGNWGGWIDCVDSWMVGNFSGDVKHGVLGRGETAVWVVEDSLGDDDEVGYLTLILAVFLLKFGELVLEELVIVMNYDGDSFSSDDEDEEEEAKGEATLFPFSLVGFLEMSKGFMTRLWNVNLASGTMA
ncbi:hypothetical protein Tco_0058620 [Tanacetum coccineum]